MLVKSIHLGLQLDLVLVHLLRVLLKSTDFISNAVFVLLKLLQKDSELLLLHLSFFALNILILISLQELLLSILVLIILALKVT